MPRKLVTYFFRQPFCTKLCSCLVPFLVATASHGQSRLQLLDNSPSLSQALDINATGDVIGRKDVELPKIGFGEQSYFWDGEQELPMPKLEGYTNAQVEALSDNGHAVGYAGRSFDSPDGGLEACLWNTQENTVRGLGKLENHRSSQAFDISADGNTIVGYSSGRNPATMVPVVWSRQGDQWTCEALPTVHEFNPYLLTGRVVISGDGSKIAASITEEIVERPLVKKYICHTYVWQRDMTDEWYRRKIAEHQLKLGDINDAGMLTGSARVGQHRRAFVIDREGKFQLLDLLPGDVSAEANDVNNDGVVVGFSDDPLGPEGGPTAFVWDGIQVKPLGVAAESFFSLAASINDRGDVCGYLIPKPPEPAGDADGPEANHGDDSSVLDRTVSFVFRTKVTD